MVIISLIYIRGNEMNLIKLSKRITNISASEISPAPDPVNNNRRGKNHVEKVSDDSVEYNDFFEFEKELAELESSRRLAMNAPGSKEFFSEEFSDNGTINNNFENKDNIKEDRAFVIMEEIIKEEKPILSLEGIILDEIDEYSIRKETNTVITYNGDEDNSSASFEFIQCNALKENSDRCKRQAPKHFMTYSISAHRKQEASINKKKVYEK